MNFSTFFVKFESFVGFESFEDITASPPATEAEAGEAVGFLDFLTNLLDLVWVLGFAVVLTVEMGDSLKIPWRRVYSEEPTLLIALRAGRNVSVRVLGFGQRRIARSRQNRTACRFAMQGVKDPLSRLRSVFLVKSSVVRCFYIAITNCIPYR